MANTTLFKPSWQNSEVDVGALMGSSVQHSSPDVEQKTFTFDTGSTLKNVDVVKLHSGEVYHADRVEPVGSLLLLHGVVPFGQDGKAPWVSFGSVQQWSTGKVVSSRWVSQRPKVAIAKTADYIYQALDCNIIGNKIIMPGNTTTIALSLNACKLLPSQVSPLVLHSFMLESYEEIELAPLNGLKPLNRAWHVIKTRGGAEFRAVNVTYGNGSLSMLQPMQLYTLFNGQAAFVSLDVRCLDVCLPQVASWTHAAMTTTPAPTTMKVEVVEMQDGAVYAAMRVQPAGSQLLLYGAVRVAQSGVVLRQKTVMPTFNVSIGSLADWRQAHVSKDLADDVAQCTTYHPNIPKALVFVDKRFTRIMGTDVHKARCPDALMPIVIVPQPHSRDLWMLNQKDSTTYVACTVTSTAVITQTACVSITTSLMNDFTQALPQAAIWLLRCVTRTFPRTITAASNDGITNTTIINSTTALSPAFRQVAPQALVSLLASLATPIPKTITDPTNVMPCAHWTEVQATVITSITVPVPDALLRLLSCFTRTYPKAITAAGDRTLCDNKNTGCRLVVMVDSDAINGRNYSRCMRGTLMFTDRMRSAHAFITTGSMTAAFQLTSSSITVLPFTTLPNYPLAIANSSITCNRTSHWFAAKFVIAIHPELRLAHIRAPFKANTFNVVSTDVCTALSPTVCMLTTGTPVVPNASSVIRVAKHTPRHTIQHNYKQRCNVYRGQSPLRFMPLHLTLADEHSDDEDEATHEMHSLNIQLSLKAAVGFARSNSNKVASKEDEAGISSDSDVESGCTPLSDCSSTVWTDEMPALEGLNLKSPATPMGPNALCDPEKSTTDPIADASMNLKLDNDFTTDSDMTEYDSGSEDYDDEDVDEPAGLLAMAVSGVRTAVHWGVCLAGVSVLLQTASWLLDMPAEM